MASQVTATEVEWPCPAQYNVLGCDFFNDVDDAQTNHSGRPFFFFCARDMADINIRNYKTAHNLREKRRKPGFPFVWICGSNMTLSFRSKFSKLSGASQKCHFFIIYCDLYLTYIWNRVLVIYLDGWRIGQ